MSTRSFIGYVNAIDKFVGIYCHYDGYPEHVGKILVEHHNSFAAMEDLLDGSHIRGFDHDGTISRFGEGDGSVETFDSVKDALNSGFDYAYVYSDNDNCWKCFGHSRDIFGGIKEFEIPGNTPWEK